MRIWEETEISGADLPVSELKDHLRMGSGFADDGLQDALVAGYLRAAMTAIEGRIGKALLLRDFVLDLPGWRDPAAQPLPIAPVSEVVSVSVLEGGAGGTSVVVPAHRWYLEPDLHRPRLVAKHFSLPAVPSGARARIALKAGFGAWSDIPSDLRQAVLLLAAQFYEYRHEGTERRETMSFGVMALIERWRNVRVLGGGR